MRNVPKALVRSRTRLRFMMLVAAICLLSSLALPSVAAPTLSVTVVNNSDREIRHLYLAQANTDNWGPDQLNQSPISPGVSRTITVSWDQSTVKLVAEDQDGCFLSTTIQASGEQSWTITGSTSRDCG
jgi:hypothetical protein